MRSKTRQSVRLCILRETFSNGVVDSRGLVDAERAAKSDEVIVVLKRERTACQPQVSECRVLHRGMLRATSEASLIRYLNCGA